MCSYENAEVYRRLLIWIHPCINKKFSGERMFNFKFAIVDSREWSTTLRRRYNLLRTFLLIFLVMSPVFIVVNYHRKVYITAVSEVVFWVTVVLMLYYGRTPGRQRFVSFLFVLMSCVLAIVASSNSGTHPTVAAWNSLCVLFAFYLLGRRYGTLISMVFVPVSTFIYVMKHSSGANAIPLVAILNVSFFMLCISLIAYYFETTRSETEGALLEDIDSRVKTESDLEAAVQELKKAIGEIKTLSGLLPICASCKRIRDDKGAWTQIESYIKKNSEAEFSHGICPDCARKLYPDLFNDE